MSAAESARAGDTVADWVALVDAACPERDAASWDATGLQVGAPAQPVTAVLVVLDVTDATLDEAARRGAQLVLAHHPLLFRPLARLTPSTAAGRLALRAAREGTAVLAAHTNLDAAVPGTSDPAADVLGLRERRTLDPLHQPDGHGAPAGTSADTVKLVTFVPTAATPEVVTAVSAAGAGRIGEYDECSFRVTGTGTFRPSAAANPTVGDRGVRNEETEDRLEVVLPRAALGAVVATLVAAHPYEEVAWDAYPLLGPPTEAAPGAGPDRDKGIGLVGELPAPRPLGGVCDALAAGLPAPHLRVSGDLDRPVRRVAVVGGAGESYADRARRAGADVLVTGDCKHHPTLDAATLGLAVVDAGHHATEAAALPAFRAALAADAADRGLTARLLASAVDTAPWAAYTPPAGNGGGGTA